MFLSNRKSHKASKSLYLVLVCLIVTTLSFNGANATESDYLAALWEKQLEDGHYFSWTIEERFEFEQPWVEYLRTNVNIRLLSGLPAEDDIKQAEALEIARNAVREEYGEDAFFDSREWTAESTFFNIYFTGEREWLFLFNSKAIGSTNDPISCYDVWINAKTGDVTRVVFNEEVIKDNPN